MIVWCSHSLRAHRGSDIDGQEATMEFEISYTGMDGLDRTEVHLGDAESTKHKVTFLEERGAHGISVEAAGGPSIDVGVSPVIDSRNKFDYMLLSRLQQDCEYYLGFGGRHKKHLWAQDESAQIQKMRELYERLPEKPEWITLADIEKYEVAMVQPKVSKSKSASLGM